MPANGRWDLSQLLMALNQSATNKLKTQPNEIKEM